MNVRHRAFSVKSLSVADQLDDGIARSGRSALWVGAGILASRLIGLVRQRVFAHYFGDSWIADAFTAALRLPNTTQNLLGEGTLSASFIPIYVQLEGREPERARVFARDCLGLLLLATAIVSLAGAIFARPLTHALVPGFDGERFALAVHLVRIFFPMTGILVLSAWSLGVLNSHRRFFLPYVAPVVWSLSQIVALVAGARFAARGSTGGHPGLRRARPVRPCSSWCRCPVCAASSARSYRASCQPPRR